MKQVMLKLEQELNADDVLAPNLPTHIQKTGRYFFDLSNFQSIDVASIQYGWTD
jgi:hypothetical protein